MWWRLQPRVTGATPRGPMSRRQGGARAARATPPHLPHPLPLLHPLTLLYPLTSPRSSGGGPCDGSML